MRELKKKALEHKHDSAVLGLVDGFLESALQLLLQLYFSLSRQIHMDFGRGKFVFNMYTCISVPTFSHIPALLLDIL